MIAQWENECFSLSVLSIARVQLPAIAEYFKGFFPDWSHAGASRNFSNDAPWETLSQIPSRPILQQF